MLENIKMLLSIKDTDTSKDKLINYWIDYYTKMVLKYCHLIELNKDLEAIIEQIIISRLAGLGIGENNKANQTIPEGVKSITRGDYSITYKDTLGEKQQSIYYLDKFAIEYRGQLNLWRRLDY